MTASQCGPVPCRAVEIAPDHMDGLLYLEERLRSSIQAEIKLHLEELITLYGNRKNTPCEARDKKST